ncbi:Ubiquinone biosynthesis O-methyltransferase [subsurface metagenome]|nr:methyltransferase domain-containing protein [bacterium]
MNQEKLPVVKSTEIERKIWDRLTPRKTGGLVRNKVFRFRDCVDWDGWYRKPEKLNPDDWERSIMAGCRGEWFAHVVEGRQKVLDVGCGFGFPSFYLARYGHEVVGVDPSPSEIATARAIAERMENPGTRNTRNTRTPSGHFHYIQDYRPVFFGHNTRFEVIEENKLPFADNSFDAATLSTSLECMGEPEVLLKELKRVLRPGSPIAIEEEDRPVTPVTPKTHPVWEKSSWAFFTDEIWLWYELRITEPHLDRRYMLRLDMKGKVAHKLQPVMESVLSKKKGMPVMDFEKVDIGLDEALAEIVDGEYSEARGYDPVSLKDLLERMGFTDLRFFAKPDGAEFAKSLEKDGLLEKMPDDVRGILRALVRSVPTIETPVLGMVSCRVPNARNTHTRKGEQSGEQK